MTLSHRHVCTEAWLHTYTQVLYDMIVMSDQQRGLVTVTVVRPPVICLMCFIHSWYHWNTEKMENNGGYYQTLMTHLQCQVRSRIAVIAFYIWYVFQFRNVNPPTDCCMLCLVHREIWSLHVVKKKKEKRLALEWLLLHFIPLLWSAWWLYMMHLLVQFKDTISCEENIMAEFPLISWMVA